MKTFCAILIAAVTFASQAACALENVPAKACPKGAGPDALMALAQTCAKDLKGDANCRAHAQDDIEYVVVRDCSPEKPQGYLFIPVQPVTGVDDRHILLQPMVEIWEDAWRLSRTYPGEPPARTALAINSKAGRSQNQLHIHMSCVRQDVAAVLASANVPTFPAKPLGLTLGPGKNAYQAVRVPALGGESSPFKVAAMLPGVAAGMKDESIAVIGSPRADDYYVVSTTAGGTNLGHAEELLDQACK